VRGVRSTFKKGERTTHGDYKVDPAQKPKALDIEIADGPEKGKAYLSIYEFKDGELRICHALPGNPRPKAFVSEAGSGQVLEVWKKKP
jgi:uncharacterized protein (TIGR03067 family)